MPRTGTCILGTIGLSESGVDIALAHHVTGERDSRVGNKGGVFIDVGDSSCSREQPPPTLLLEKCLGWRGVCVSARGVRGRGCLNFTGVLSIASSEIRFKDARSQSCQDGDLSVVAGEESPRLTAELQAARKRGTVVSSTSVAAAPLSQILPRVELPLAVDLLSVRASSGLLRALKGASLGHNRVSAKWVLLHLRYVEEDDIAEAEQLLRKEGLRTRWRHPDNWWCLYGRT